MNSTVEFRNEREGSSSCVKTGSTISEILNWQVAPRAAVLLFGVLLSSCSLGLESSVPAVRNNVKTDHIKVSTILTALKCQMARGRIRIDLLKAQNPKNTNMKDFKLKSGTGVFKGTTQILEKNGASINAVIPFSGIDGTNVTPRIGGERSATNLQQTSITFSINPNLRDFDKVEIPVSKRIENGPRYDPAVCGEKILLESGIEIGDFIERSMVALFKDLTSVPVHYSGKRYGLIMTGKEIQILTDFKIVQKLNGGVSSKILFGTPRVDNIGPSLSVDSDKTGVYNLLIKLPLDTGNETPSKRLHYCIQRFEKQLCVEEPYSKERLDELQKELSKLDELVPFSLETEEEGEEEVREPADWFLQLQQGPKF